MDFDLSVPNGFGHLVRQWRIRKMRAAQKRKVFVLMCASGVLRSATVDPPRDPSSL